MSVPQSPPRALAVPLVLCLAALLALRLGQGAGPRHDEAEQIVCGQSLAWGYSGQPPLYTWLVWLFSRVLGLSVLTLALVKTAVLAFLGVALHAAARRLLGEGRPALLSVFSLAAMPVLAWNFIRDHTHTPLSCGLAAATLHAVLRLKARPSLRGYALLGVWLGLGMMSKYQFAVLVLALAGAALTLPAYRRRVVDRRLALTLVVAVGLCAPHFLWVFDHWDTVHGFLAMRAEVGQSSGALAGWLRGAGTWAWTGLVFLAPALGLLLFWFGRELRADRVVDDGVRLLERMLVLSALLLLVVMAAAGVTRYHCHWHGPFLMLAPVWFFGRFSPAGGWSPRPLGGYGRCLAVVAAGLLLARAEPLLVGQSDSARKARARDDAFARLAGRLRARGFVNGSVIVTDHVVGAHLLVHLPGVRVSCAYYPACAGPDADGAGRYLLLWERARGPRAPGLLRAFLRREFRLKVPARAPVRSGPAFAFVVFSRAREG